jgi:hypothetical protein
MVDTINKSYRNILFLGGLLNTIGILVFSKCFTNEVIIAYHPSVMSNFGLMMLMPWGLLMFVMAWHYNKLPKVILILALEKIIYVVVWVKWILRNDLRSVFEVDLMAGIFYSVFGVNDMLFFIAFVYIYFNTKQTIANKT